MTACVADSYWEFMMTSQFICTPAELKNGAAFGLYVPGTVPARHACRVTAFGEA